MCREAEVVQPLRLAKSGGTLLVSLAWFLCATPGFTAADGIPGREPDPAGQTRAAIAAPPPDTLAHTILRLEIEDDTALTLRLTALETLLEEIHRALARHPSAPKSERVQAVRFFRTVDEVLMRRGFAFAPDGQVSLLAESLEAMPAQATELPDLLRLEPNWRRRIPIQRLVRQRKGLHWSDCDTTALICLAAAERAGFPCHLVEVPGHIFVRWSGGARLNWDPNTARHLSDAHYREAAGLTTPRSDHPTFLNNLARAGILGYWTAVVARQRAKEGRHAAARQLFEEAGRLAPDSLYAAHGRAWFLATCPDAAFRDGPAAVRLLTPWVRRYPEPSLLDSLAVALAESGDFAGAVAAERAALTAAADWPRSRYAIQPWPNFQAMLRLFERGQTYARALSAAVGDSHRNTPGDAAAD